ncbi:MAG: C10 family peptidase [Muribaculaceae bacterium]|nr:C10 family peptidase [Muribaculaceae bacterium]
MTNKTLALLAVAMQVAVSSLAGPVTADQAREAAAAFVQQKQGTQRTLRMASQSPTMQAAANTGYYYIYNVGNDNGFVIVSGDDRTTPILGYSTVGQFDAAKVPTNLQGMLDGYARQLQALAAMSDVEAATRLAAPRRTTTVNTRNSIAPMITTNWDQATPYWNHCPQFMNSEDEADGYELAYTGCVATAMAQVMKYHNWPAQCSQTIPSYTVTYSTGDYNYGTFNTDELAPMAFDWAHMKDNYTGAEEEVYTEAVSWLMLYAGCAAHMQYGLSASGTSDPYIPKAFNNYFDYDAKLVYRSDYDQQAWEDMIYNELANGRPMIYNGRAGSGGGHSFVCDGYEYGDYYHINWGWGGMGNGYFVLSVLNPHAGGIGSSSSAEGYNIDQTAIIGIKPGYSGPSEEVNHVLTVFNMYYSGSSRTLDRGSQGFSLYKRRYIKVTAEDHIDDGTKYRRGIALYDNSGNFLELIMSSNIYSGYLSVTDNWPETNDSQYYYFGKSIGNGTYRIVPVSMEQGSDEWKPMLESDRYYIEMNVSGDYATLTDHPLVDLQSTKFEFSGGEKTGTAEQCNVTVKNNSVDRFNGKLYFYLTNEQIDEYGEYVTVVETEIAAGAEKVVTFNFTPQNAGTKTAQLSLYDNSMGGSKIPGTGTVTITGNGSTDFDVANLSVVIRAENAVAGDNEGDNGVIYDSHAHFSAAITNSGDIEYNKYILAPLFILEDGKGSMVGYQQLTIAVPAGETRTYYFDFDNLAYGSTYALNIYARNNVPMDEDASHVDNIVKPGESVYYDIRPGIIVWNADGTRQCNKPVDGFVVPTSAAAVSIENVTLSGITPNANPNTIYILAENANVPASLNGKNVVKGQTATEIVLEDGYPYLVPQSVNAGKVTYKRTFTQARKADERTAWSTMVLPFAATNVEIDGRTPVANTDYWVYNFPREEDGVVSFDAVSSMEANVPYLVAVADGRDMTGKVMSWSAQDVTLKADPIAITSGQHFMLSGTYIAMSEGGIYTMDAQGSRFVLHDTPQTVAPFRAYFKAMQTGLATEILCPGSTEVEPQTLLGDVNNDGMVDVEDVNILINIVLGTDSADNYGSRAFVTEDDTKVDVADINEVINIMLNR